SYRPGQWHKWHPGWGFCLAGRGAAERADWRFYREYDEGFGVDAAAFLAARSRTVEFVHRLLQNSLEKPAHLGCFGLHEWAMVYSLGPGEQRHEQLPLRLGQAGTDEVVRELTIRCSHFDAFRFFTPPARDRNSLQPTRADQASDEQPGCLHAGMDLYKWCYKLSPAIPSSLITTSFLLARDIRLLDMQASPYDLGELGIPPVPIETPAGRAEYAQRQREFSLRGQEIRRTLLASLQPLLG
ncbi:MAG: 3-methyladenine DNA glycosylase, partial [Angustibacter sp.]